jgi:CxxC-x17-CxxC domain-containing protein
MTQFHDKTLTCVACGAQWIWTVNEQEFYARKGLQHEPKRCMACRCERNNALAASRRRDGRYRSSDADRPAMQDAICSDCGGLARVPFTPTPGRPVYCSRCWHMHKPQKGGTE